MTETESVYLKGLECMKRSQVQEALELFSKAADGEHPRALYALYECYGNGNGVSKNSRKALNFLERSASAGYVPAMSRAGQIYVRGELGGKDMRKGMEWLIKASDFNDSDACLVLGEVYLDGLGDVPRDERKGALYLVKAVTKGDANAMSVLGMCYMNGRGVIKDEKRAYKLFETAVAKGCDEAYAQLAQLLLHGIGCDADVPRAFRLLEQAGERNHPVCWHLMADIYWGRTNVQGVDRDRTKALRYYEKASDKWGPSAYELGRCYMIGMGVTKDVTKGTAYLEHSIALGCTDAMTYYGACLILGDDVKRSVKKGIKLIQEAASLGNIQAKAVLGVAYRDGNGVQRNVTKSFEILSEAAQSGNAIALHRLAESMANGWGCNQDNDQATNILEQLVKAGYPNAMHTLAQILLDGTEKTKAFTLLIQAADSGHSEAQLTLGLAYLNGDGVDKNTVLAKHYLDLCGLTQSHMDAINNKVQHNNNSGYDTCPICQQTVDAICETPAAPCGHSMCHNCAVKYFGYSFAKFARQDSEEIKNPTCLYCHRSIDIDVVKSCCKRSGRL